MIAIVFLSSKASHPYYLEFTEEDEKNLVSVSSRWKFLLEFIMAEQCEKICFDWQTVVKFILNHDIHGFFFFWNHKVIICLNLSKMFSTTWKCCWSQTCCLDLWTRIIQLRFPWNSISLLENRRQSNSFKHSKSFKRLNWLHQTVESSFWFIGKRKAHGTFFGSRNEGEERF